MAHVNVPEVRHQSTERLLPSRLSTASPSTRLSTAREVTMRRYDSTSRLNRLSLAVSSTLTSVLEMVDTRRSRDSAEQPRSSMARPRSSLQHLDLSLQQELQKATLVEPPTESYVIYDNIYPGIRALRTDAEVGDGIWLCCHCRHENILRHYCGAFPFQYLRCARCTRTLCSDCHSSEIISPLPYGMICAPPRRANQEIRYFQVCTTCGLSHRAEMEGTTLDFYGVTCAGCGASSYGDWPRYHIGTNEPYRADPNVSFARLIEQRAIDASRLAFRWCITNLASEDEEYSSLEAVRPSEIV